MRPIILYNHYVLLEPDGELRCDTITEEYAFAVCHLAGSVPSSVVSKALEKGYKLIKCDIVFTNIKPVDIE